MPEYLAPAVYVEEVDTGSKPIEGVSTSTAGMIGVTERGPVNVPILITSYGEYGRWFGGRLAYADFGDRCYLPIAIEGFFVNGGKRVYVTRVLDTTGATSATQPLFDRGTASSIETTLLRAAPEATGTVANGPGLLVLPVTGPALDDWIRLGTGSSAEYRRAAGAAVAEDVMVSLHLPLSRNHAAGTTVKDYIHKTLSGSFTLASPAAAGAGSIGVTGSNAHIADLVAAVGTAPACLEIGGADTTESAIVGEYRFALEASQLQVGATTSTVRLRLDAPLAVPRAGAEVVVRIDLSVPAAPAPAPASATVVSASAGSALLFVDSHGTNFSDRTHLAFIQGDGQEVRRIGTFTGVQIVLPASTLYPAGSLIAAVTVSEFAPAISAAAVANAILLQLSDASGFAVGQQVIVNPGAATQETRTVAAVDKTTNQLTVKPPLTAAHVVSERVTPASVTTAADAAAGARVLALGNRLGLAEGDVLLVGSGARPEYVTLVALPATTGLAPDAGNVVIYPGLANAWPAGTPVSRQTFPAPVAGRQRTALAIDAPEGAKKVYLADGAAFSGVIRVTTPGGDVTYHRIDGAPAAVQPEVLTLQTALSRAHPAGSVVVGRGPLVDAQAIDPGAWGNRLRISVEDEATGLVSRTTLAAVVDTKTIRLASAAGVQAGTVLEFFDPASGAVVGGAVKVNDIDRAANFTIRLATGLTLVQQAPGLGVRSREFSLTVRLLRQPDPANPARNDQVIDAETFRYLSMDPRHTNYVERVIGAIDGPPRLSDRRPEGASQYIRLRDRATNDTTRHGARVGPEALLDVLPGGLVRAARHALEQAGGDDSMATLTADHYVGQDDPNPENRTGLQGLRNIEEISIVAAPGQIDAQAQNALINHCELMRYRFAVLDGGGPPNDSMAAIQAQRQRYDTKYASLYHPWLLIPDPYPPTPGQARDFPIPPSGHMVGIYARTDIERGVHKAPANEVVRGVTGLQRLLNKEQHDILNPYPVNINVIRDFRPNNRGIRVYGGRVITSDSDWKYVNVRRLLIFIEASIDRGLQWVVFEPNAEPLWARVRRSISNFLTLVWRNGALEGTKVEEAYFVKCDRTTMTQTDIDSGRLICLVGVAPVKPAEFVIVRIGLWTAHAEE